MVNYYQNQDDYLLHYGVKGMKWGVVKASAKATKRAFTIIGATAVVNTILAVSGATPVAVLGGVVAAHLANAGAFAYEVSKLEKEFRNGE